MSDQANENIESVLQETRSFPPPAEFVEQANISSMEEYQELWNRAKDDPAGFWGDLAQDLEWSQPYESVIEGEMPETKWFKGGKINASVNCIDRHLDSWRKNKAAIIWEGEPGDTRVLRYQDLYREVCKFANCLKKLGVETGDRVTLYMPMVPELAIAMLACSRIGATHSIIFGGFSADAIADRNNDAQAKLVITADGGWRRGKNVALKEAVDQSMEKSPSVEKVVVYRRTGCEVDMVPDRDYWWHDLMEDASPECDPVELDSDHPLFILYTSGSTGKPKGVQHSTGGYLLGAKMTSEWVFDLKEDDTYWCTADIGWITGHSYIVYGPLANGATTVMYEGAPNWPDEGRFWEIVEKYQVNIFYTAPTAIRAFIKWGDEWPNKYDLSSLRLLGTVGEPINPEAWMWYHTVIGQERCPIVDTWWQTETGGIMMSPLPGVTATKPGSCTTPLPGVVPDIVSADGESLGDNQGGLLVMRQPWPHMLRTLYGDHERFKDVYFSTIPGCYLAGDSARRDEDGYYWIMGRIDDVINVSGHRLSTMEVESALVSHPKVAEAAVVGYPHELKGEGICCFVSLKSDESPDELKEELKQHVRTQIGVVATPDQIRFAAALPKTRSGKIMRRLLRDIAAGRESTGDTTTLEDFNVIANLSKNED
ncbi:acetate--CoA ligase [Gimesia maris]|mgnify:FL=1|uniref:Acetyl-coenzyme A synthetase n=1 Tax=Gimesia maris TaxID=122 RepID=A0ABX5YFC9_9PLAN|nr:acetate--CoA ligase [Gimesia maris]EDL57177.1 Acetate--CoA ligase [Gimesia maris DSM 8797]QDT76734.1 Acetyl-coenzyme A ligase [Gimesia maris]QDU12372.1 Acetyl-coenzyme A ligase [Gimesia maris]QEG14311.1 Acetyl-coenzyme A ligase [Gimesia maris]QGQ32241.1 acetate--CoA ligase [Gimesia maris]